MKELDKLFKELGEKIQELVEQAKDATGDVREEMKGTIEQLKKQRDKVEEKMVDFRTKNEPKIDEAKHHLKTAIDEISKAFEKMFKKGPSAEEEK
jgi:phosphoglycerate-specific signal transduction histidine kinase